MGSSLLVGREPVNYNDTVNEYNNDNDNNNGNFHSYILKYIQSRIISITKLCSKLSITGH